MDGRSVARLVAAEREAPQAVRLAAGVPGLLAVGGRACKFRPSGDLDTCMGQLWASETGRDWQRIDDPELAVGTALPTSGPEPGFLDIAARGDVAVVLGWAMDERGHVGIWRLTSDLEVERLPVGDVFDDSRPQAVVATPDGFAAVGTAFTRDRPVAAAWWSTDGVRWNRAADGPWSAVGGYLDTMEEPGYGGMRAVTAYPGGLAAVGSICDSAGANCTPATWQSADGRKWERGSTRRGEGLLTSVAWTGDSLVAFGGDWEEPGLYVEWGDGSTSNAGWPMFQSAATSGSGVIVLGWNSYEAPSLWHWSPDGTVARIADVPPLPDVAYVRGGDVEIVGSTVVVLICAEAMDGIVGWVMVGPPP